MKGFSSGMKGLLATSRFSPKKQLSRENIETGLKPCIHSEKPCIESEKGCLGRIHGTNLPLPPDLRAEIVALMAEALVLDYLRGDEMPECLQNGDRDPAVSSKADEADAGR